MRELAPVGGDEDQPVIAPPCAFQRRHQLADAVIELDHDIAR
jgi:hypothetical protein